MFGLPGVFAVRLFAEHGYAWTFMGFPIYGQAPFEDWGRVSTMSLITRAVNGRIIWLTLIVLSGATRGR